jgi:GNAT superfamily N-acetyltransferase
MRKAAEFHPVTPDRWPDLERLFRESAGEELGNPSRCWCMEWRLPDREQWKAGAGEPNRRAMERFVTEGNVPGIVAYVDGEPAGWCSISPRPSLIGLERAGGFRRFADPDIWSVICFYVPETHRGQGLMRGLLEAAVAYAASNGARIVEGYPFDAKFAGDGAGGTIETFAAAGFEETARISEHQATMRYRTA